MPQEDQEELPGPPELRKPKLEGSRLAKLLPQKMSMD